jgi:Protein of unknown function (DUF3307)
VAWVEIFAVLVVSHAVGDYLLQTDWQALNKRGGLGTDPIAQRALVSHVVSYTAAFVPAAVWLGDDLAPLGVVALLAAIFFPHLVQDDGRLLSRYVRTVKGEGAAANPALVTSVDQSLHIVVLFATAIAIHAATT